VDKVFDALSELNRRGVRILFAEQNARNSIMWEVIWAHARNLAVLQRKASRTKQYPDREVLACYAPIHGWNKCLSRQLSLA